MISDLVYVLDDMLEVKFQYEDKERREILRFLLKQNGKVKNHSICLLDCFVFNDILVCLNRKEDIKIQKFVYWDDKKGGRLFVHSNEKITT